MNELTVNQVLQANSPVIPAGVISLRILPKSTCFESLAVVSGVGCSKSVWSSFPQGIERERLFHSFKRLSLSLYLPLTACLSNNLQMEFVPFKLPAVYKMSPPLSRLHLSSESELT